MEADINKYFKEGPRGPSGVEILEHSPSTIFHASVVPGIRNSKAHRQLKLQEGKKAWI